MFSLKFTPPYSLNTQRGWHTSDRFCASSWLITKIILRCTVSKTSKSQITVLHVETAVPNIRTAATFYSLVDVVHRFVSSSQAWLTTWPGSPASTHRTVRCRLVGEPGSLLATPAQSSRHNRRKNNTSDSKFTCHIIVLYKRKHRQCLHELHLGPESCDKMVFRKHKTLSTYKPLRHIRGGGLTPRILNLSI